jgi:glucose dehydrogenase
MVTKWEYQVTETDHWDGEVTIEIWLNNLGKYGWELVHVSSSLRTYFLKRPLQEEDSSDSCERSGK